MGLRAPRTLAAFASRTCRRHFHSGLQKQQQPPCEPFGTKSAKGGANWKDFYHLSRASAHLPHGRVFVNVSEDCEDISCTAVGIAGGKLYHCLCSSCASDGLLGGNNVSWSAAPALRPNSSQGSPGPNLEGNLLMSYLNWMRYEQLSHLQQSDLSKGVQVGFIEGTEARHCAFIGSKGLCERSSIFSVSPVVLDGEFRNVVPLEVSSVKRKRKKKMNKHKHRKLRKRDRHRN